MPLLLALIAAIAPGIRTPGGNISCFVGAGKTLHCDIVRAAYRPTLQQLCTSRASLDWHGFDLAPGNRGVPACSGGTLGSPRYRTLAFGATWHSPPFTCVSRDAGLTCTTGSHGLFISRRSWRGW